MDLNALEDFIYQPKEKVTIDYFKNKFNMDDFLATICYNEFHNLNSDNVIKEQIEKQKELNEFFQNNVFIIN